MSTRSWWRTVCLIPLAGACRLDAAGLAVERDVVTGSALPQEPDASASGVVDAGGPSPSDEPPEGPCDGAECACPPGEPCVAECPYQGCAIECAEAESCESVCLDDCTVSCDHKRTCETSCGEACSTTCSNADRCGLTCEAGCQLDCHNLGACDARVGPASVVTCRDTGACHIVCTGPCQVTCDRVGACDVQCDGLNLVPLDAPGEHGCRAADDVVM